MTRSQRRLLLTLAGWTIFVWGTRISNAWRSTSETTGAKVSSTILAVVFVLFAVATVGIVWRTRHAVLDRTMGVVLQAFAVWTTGVWLVRGVAILIDGHGAAFKLVHTVLAVISIALASVAWRVGSRGWSREVAAG